MPQKLFIWPYYTHMRQSENAAELYAVLSIIPTPHFNQLKELD